MEWWSIVKKELKTIIHFDASLQYSNTPIFYPVKVLT